MSKDQSIAIVTGASAGLGIEFLKKLGSVYPEIETYWVIARRADRLEALKDILPDKQIRPIPLDLTAEDSYTELEDILREEKPKVKVLINNAGFGKRCDFTDAPWEPQMRQCDLNVRALTVLTSLVLPYMVRGSSVINVCSIAAFVPTPNMTVYCSTKAYVYSFSKSLRAESKPRGINVLAVCPGPMATEFLDVADITGRSKTFDTLPYCKPEQVACKALKAARAGRGVYTNKGIYKLYRLLSKIIPHRLFIHFTST